MAEKDEMTLLESFSSYAEECNTWSVHNTQEILDFPIPNYFVEKSTLQNDYNKGILRSIFYANEMRYS